MPRAATPCAWKPAAKRAGQTPVIRYTLASELDAGSARLQYWAVDKTPQVEPDDAELPQVAAALDNGC